MMRHLFYGSLVFLMLLGIRPADAASPPDSPPNFLCIIADDCTYRDLGCYGGQARTPNIDRLASEGMRMLRCFQCAPMCSPTRQNIYTGQYPIKTGAYPNHTAVYAGTRSIVQALTPLGYRMALSGKRHIGPKTVFDFEYSGKKNPDMKAVNRLFKETAASKQPFCLFACSNEPHTPWNKGNPALYPTNSINIPPYLADTPEIREAFSRYLAEISFFDNQVGQLLELLDKHGLAKNTIVMVLSEQGNSMPLAKWTCYDTGLQSAMIVRWPGRITPGSTSNAMVEYVDITPTFVDVAGADSFEEFDGSSFLPVLMGQKNEHKSFVYGEMTTHGIINGNDCFPIRSVRSDRYKLIWNLKHDQTFTNACTQSPEFKSLKLAAAAGNDQASWVIQKYQHRPEFEFYDLHQDPFEMQNRIDDLELATIIAQHKLQLQNWMESQGDKGIETELKANWHLKSKE